MKLLICILLIAIVHRVHSSSVAEILAQTGTAGQACLNNTDILCDHGNGTISCTSIEDHDPSLCVSSFTYGNCSVCESLNLETCHQLNATTRKDIYIGAGNMEICSDSGNCEELVNNTGVITQTLFGCAADCCSIGRNVSYWRTHNLYATPPNNISWPSNLEFEKLCPNFWATYYNDFMVTDNNLGLWQIRREIILFYINTERANSFDNGSSCITQSERDYIDTARAFINLKCPPLRWTSQDHAFAATFIPTMQEINSRLLCS